MSRTINFYHFLISPWAYLAIDRFNEICSKHDVKVLYKPIDVMGTFENMGGVPPMKRHPSRQRFRMDEMKRWSAYLNKPINLNPAHFPVPTAVASQMVYASGGAEGDPNAGKLSDAILKACWLEEKDVSDEATLVAIADALSLDGAALLKKAKDPAMEALFMATTEEAHNRDVFGSPTYELDGELFWGQDRLDFLERALA